MRGLQVLTIFSVIVGFAAADGGRIALPDIELNRCLGKDGVFLPVPGSCYEYIICVKGTAVVRTCGTYHFDARRSVCDLPANAGCITFGPEPLNPVDTMCLGRMNGTKLPIQGSSNKFYLCEKEKAFLQTCGANQFDEKTMQCIVPIPKPLVAPCSGVANGVKVPVRGNPRQYYFCMNNRPFLKDCGNMYFVAKHSACALSPDGEEEPPRIELPPMIIPSPQTDSAVILAPQKPPSQYDPLAQKMCLNQRLGARVPLPGSCSHYYICMGNTGVLKSCGQLQFNPITTSCDIASNVHCSVQTNGVFYGSHDAVRPTPENSTSVQLCYGQRDGIFVAAPGKCSDFYFCLRNHGYLKTCGKRHFSPITLSCVDIELSNCVEVSPVVQSAPEPTNTSSCLSRDNGVLLRHSSECGKFLICDNHVAVEMECPAGLHFNPERNYCDWPDMAGCL